MRPLLAWLRLRWRIARSDRRRARIEAQERRYLALVRDPSGPDSAP